MGLVWNYPELGAYNGAKIFSLSATALPQHWMTIICKILVAAWNLVANGYNSLYLA
jgi:hypothetical protein